MAHEKSVYLCFRPTNAAWALAIYQSLAARGFDVFLNQTGEASQTSARANILGRAHFLALITPSGMRLCLDPADPLRREIETALEAGRHLVPLLPEGFTLDSPSIAARLTGRLAELRACKSLELPLRYFQYALRELEEEYLAPPVALPPAELTPEAAEAARTQQQAAQAAAPVPPAELAAEHWFERASNAGDPEEIIGFYTKAIEQRPAYAAAYLNRGNARLFKGDLEGALADYTETIRIQPGFANAYFNRGAVRNEQGDHAGAVADFDEAIRLEPRDPSAYQARAQAKEKSGDAAGAERDFAVAKAMGYSE